MLQFYADTEAARKGDITAYPHTDVVSFAKVHQAEEVVVIANVRNANVSYTLPSDLANTVRWDVMAQDSISIGAERNLSAYQFYLLR